MPLLSLAYSNAALQILNFFGQPFHAVPGLGFSWAVHSRQPQARGHCTGTPERVSSSHFKKDLEFFKYVIFDKKFFVKVLKFM
jgi:hypothetical protein